MDQFVRVSTRDVPVCPMGERLVPVWLRAWLMPVCTMGVWLAPMCETLSAFQTSKPVLLNEFRFHVFRTKHADNAAQG
eukprot:1161429-Pelagomonas_calceolata.AAC.4